MTPSMTARVDTLASSGSPAWMATSWRRATSETIRWTVSALRLRAWNCWDSPWTWQKTRSRRRAAARELMRAKHMVAT